jgi:hypothetical protein
MEMKLGRGPRRLLGSGGHGNQQNRQQNPHPYDSIDANAICFGPAEPWRAPVHPAPCGIWQV